MTDTETTVFLVDKRKALLMFLVITAALLGLSVPLYWLYEWMSQGDPRMERLPAWFHDYLAPALAPLTILVVMALASRRFFANPALVMSAEGIEYRMGGLPKIPWAQIRGVRQGEFFGRSYLDLELHDPDAFIKTLSPSQRRAFELVIRRKGGGPWIDIHVLQQGERVEEILKHHLSRHGGGERPPAPAEGASQEDVAPPRSGGRFAVGRKGRLVRVAGWLGLAYVLVLIYVLQRHELSTAQLAYLTIPLALFIVLSQIDTLRHPDDATRFDRFEAGCWLLIAGGIILTALFWLSP